MEDIKYIEIKTVNRKMKLLYGDKLTRTQKAIGHRSNGLHVEIRWSDRYGRVSSSCTLAGGAGGYRYQMIGYSHGYQWSTIRIYVTAEQEARLWAKSCKMADLDIDFLSQRKVRREVISKNELFFGPNHIKYDRWGASFSFISKLRIWRMHPENMICNEAVAEVLLVEWPDLLDIKKEDGFITFEMAMDGGQLWSGPNRVYPRLDPADLTPDQFEYLVEYYFERNLK